MYRVCRHIATGFPSVTNKWILEKIELALVPGIPRKNCHVVGHISRSEGIILDEGMMVGPTPYMRYKDNRTTSENTHVQSERWERVKDECSSKSRRQRTLKNAG